MSITCDIVASIDIYRGKETPMTKQSNLRATAIARDLVREVGSQRKTAELVGVKQPSVFAWTKNGLTATRENDLRFRFPELRVWKRYPPLTSAEAN